MAGLDKRIDIWGMYHDMISGPMSKSMATMKAMFGLAQKGQKTLTGMSTLQARGALASAAALNKQAAALNRTAAAVKTYAAAMARGAAAATAFAARSAAAGSRVMFGPQASGVGVPRLRFTPIQQGMAAMGGMGYALGRGGATTLLPLGSLYGSYVAAKRYVDLDTRQRLLRRTADWDANTLDYNMPAFREIAGRHGTGLLDVLQGSQRLALGGMRGQALITSTEELIRASKLWENVDIDVMADSLSKMTKLFYKGKSGKEFNKNVGTWMRNFVEAVDFVEDNFPTKASELLKGFFRMQATGAFVGMAPEDAIAMLGVMMSQGEPSGERAGSRLRINIPRIKNSVIDGFNGKKRINFNGIDRKSIRDRFATGETGDYLIGVTMLALGLEKKFKGLKPGEKTTQIQKALAAMTNPESAGNLMPLFTDMDETILQYALLSSKYAEWALENNKEWVRRMENGTDFQRKMIERLKRAAGQPVWKGSSDKNLQTMYEGVQKKLDDIKSEWGMLLMSIGQALLSGPGGKLLGDLAAKLKEWREFWESFNNKTDRDNKLAAGEPIRSILSAGTPGADGTTGTATHGPEAFWPNGPNNPPGQPPKIGVYVDPATGKMWVNGRGAGPRPPHMKGHYAGNFAVWNETLGVYTFPDGRMLTPEDVIAGTRRTESIVGPNGKPGPSPLDLYLQEQYRNGSRTMPIPPLPSRKPEPDMIDKFLQYWQYWNGPTGQPGQTGAPMINQMSGPPMEVTIPPPEVKVINNSTGLVNVTVSVSPAMQSIMRNPGAAAVSGSMSDTSDRTGAIRT